MGFDILILTDHRGHSDENSVYALATALAAHEQINSVDIASRGVDENALFFSGEIDAPVSVIPAMPDLNLAKALDLFHNTTIEAEIVDYDFLLLRLPPPVPEQFFRKLAEYLPEDHIINSPSGIIRTSSKAFLIEVAELCPPIRLIDNEDQLREFTSQFNTVLKPLSGYGGAGILKVTGDDVESTLGQQQSLETFLKTWKPPYLAMEYQPRVQEGDKRTLVVNGEIMGSSLRKPAPGKWVCNVAQGGTSEHAVASDEEKHIARRLSEVLSKHGIIIFGFDTLMGTNGLRTLSEINTMSIGGIRQTFTPDNEPVLNGVVSRLVAHMEKTWFGDDT